MRMGNDLGWTPVESDVMAASNHSVGIAHPTVVPKNAAAVTGKGEGEGEGDDAEDGEAKPLLDPGDVTTDAV